MAGWLKMMNKNSVLTGDREFSARSDSVDEITPVGYRRTNRGFIKSTMLRLVLILVQIKANKANIIEAIMIFQAL